MEIKCFHNSNAVECVNNGPWSLVSIMELPFELLACSPFTFKIEQYESVPSLRRLAFLSSGLGTEFSFCIASYLLHTITTPVVGDTCTWYQVYLTPRRNTCDFATCVHVDPAVGHVQNQSRKASRGMVEACDATKPPVKRYWFYV